TASTVNQSLHRPTWSGNGNEIVFFETDLGSTTARTTLKKFTVTVTNGVATGGTATTLVTKSSTDNSIWTAEWSPSTTNSQIAYTTIASGGAHGSTLYTVAGTGGASTLVTSSSDCNFTGITWNSGASKIAIVCQYFTSPTSDTVSYYCIKIVNTSGVLQDSIGIANYKGILANNIEWSRTGIDQLAYTTAVFTNGGTEFLSGTDSVLVQDASSAGTAAFAVAGQHATWSPTNWKLAYNSATGISTVITASGTTASISTTGNMPNWKK
ncbi:MAG: hypothetical protein Q8919_14100, partial [Bacteroidota bacterium]|nr:hypothetical protein [Bacteroidota bacterium]